MQEFLVFCSCLLVSVSGCMRPIPSEEPAVLETADEIEPLQEEFIPASTEQVEDVVTNVRVTTDVGEFVIAVHSAWAPKGAAHWLKLVQMGYYDDTRFFRVIPGFMAQTGISGDPSKSKEWAEKTIEDDLEIVASNRRGYVTFAQTSQENSRSTQWFINFGNNSNLDMTNQGFPPFGKVIEGMSVVDKIYSGYGEPGGNTQVLAKAKGNSYLDKSYPKLTKILKIEVVGESAVEQDVSQDEAAEEVLEAPVEAGSVEGE